ncbi:transketolase [Saccharibacter sp. 17.LH.SD]|uniref:transketolase n=1 Tax=Saccharibacter sp. 17.LH.SD TaxID=2689393 RepID=UPI001369668F|nr:transketolase [Saccharibacter sp. 17.LH.SD]
MNTLSKLSIDTIRTLSMDGVERAKSGHPGTAMALAPAMYAFWQYEMSYYPANPLWPARDRFVLSGGHAAILLYSILYLADVYDVENGQVLDRPALTLEDLRSFRRLDSRTPGHPEYGLTAGVEVTTGPLGQGCANAVGMAMAQRWLSATYDRPSFSLFDYHITAFCGDGDIMEGVTAEAAAMAGHLKLGNLTWLYDYNYISIEGATNLAHTEDVGKRFEAYGWHVVEVKDGNDVDAIRRALQAGKAEKERPTLIILTTVIGYGAPRKAGTASAHGEPLGAEEILGAKKAYGWPEDAEPFTVPRGVKEHFAEGAGKRGEKAHKQWQDMFQRYHAQYPKEAQELDTLFAHELPKGWDRDLPVYPADPVGIASRQSSGDVLNVVAKNVPWMIGGAADLSPSTKTTIKGEASFQASPSPVPYKGRNIHFGVREHAMGAICNGMALSGLRAFCAGFLIFSDYMKAPIRLAALMHLPVIYVFTHDSIGVGEDGPTHQPVEQFAQLRATPGMTLIRPSDANEVSESWRAAMNHARRGPVALALSRQSLPTIDRTIYAPASGLMRGAYILASSEETPDVILIASGSEVSLAVGAYERLTKEGVKARVVSMPSMDLFEEQNKVYRDSVLPPSVTARVGVEMASGFGWDRYLGLAGVMIAFHCFGASAPASALMERFGFTVEAVYQAAKKQLDSQN